jgi:hypothetical protein
VSEITIDDDVLEGLTEAEQDEIIEEDAREAMFNLIEWGWDRCGNDS